MNYLVYCTNASESTVFRVPIWIETLFSPIYTGGVIYALARISDGYRPRYGEALGVGLHLWIPLFGARLVAGLFIILGLIAFVVPGILLAVRFLLIPSAARVWSVARCNIRMVVTRETSHVQP